MQLRSSPCAAALALLIAVSAHAQTGTNALDTTPAPSATTNVDAAATADRADTNAAPAVSVPKSLKYSLLPAPKNGGFTMDGYILWCSSVIKVGDTYHMFASR